eukprot:3387777-Prymnesium_polylepis.1
MQHIGTRHTPHVPTRKISMRTRRCGSRVRGPLLAPVRARQPLARAPGSQSIRRVRAPGRGCRAWPGRGRARGSARRSRAACRGTRAAACARAPARWRTSLPMSPAAQPRAAHLPPAGCPQHPSPPRSSPCPLRPS